MSSSPSTRFMILRAVDSSETETVVFGTIASSTDSIAKPATSSAWRTEVSDSGALVTTKLDPSSSTSSAPASAATMTSSSSSASGRRDQDDSAPLELPRDRAGRAEVAAVLRECVAHLGGGAVAVVGERLHEHGDTLRPVSLVHDGLEAGRLGVRAATFRDRALDVVLRHGVGARLLDRVLEREVADGSGPPSFAATMIARESFEKSWPRFASAAPFLCLIEHHLL